MTLLQVFTRIEITISMTPAIIRMIPIARDIVTMDDTGDITKMIPIRIRAMDETAAFLPSALIEFSKRLSFIRTYTAFPQMRPNPFIASLSISA